MLEDFWGSRVMLLDASAGQAAVPGIDLQSCVCTSAIVRSGSRQWFALACALLMHRLTNYHTETGRQVCCSAIWVSWATVQIVARPELHLQWLAAEQMR